MIKTYYWRTIKNPDQIKPGWNVPPFYAKGETLKIVEALFEDIRKKEFPTRPSRVGAVFVCPDLRSQFCRDSKATVFEVAVKGNTFATDSDYISSAAGYAVNIRYKVGDMGENMEQIRDLARSYWKGSPAADEIIVDGTVTILGPLKGTRNASMKKYPTAHGMVDGRSILNPNHIPNEDSIGASLDNFEVLPGLREVPISEFHLSGRSYSVQGTQRIKNLADKIQQSKKISPLIVVLDNEGPYILEGATRVEALFRLQAKSFPALVVIDLDNPPPGYQISHRVATRYLAQKV